MSTPGSSGSGSVGAVPKEQFPYCVRCSHAESEHRGVLRGFKGHVCLHGQGIAQCYCLGYVTPEPSQAGDSTPPADTEAMGGEPEDHPARFDCKECGKGIAVDEDGCCVTCGRDATVAAVPGGRWKLVSEGEGAREAWRQILEETLRAGEKDELDPDRTFDAAILENGIRAALASQARAQEER